MSIIKDMGVHQPEADAVMDGIASLLLLQAKHGQIGMQRLGAKPPKASATYNNISVYRVGRGQSPGTSMKATVRKTWSLTSITAVIGAKGTKCWSSYSD